MSRYIDIEPYEKDGWYLQKRYHNEYCEVVKTTPLSSIPTAEAELVMYDTGSWQTIVTDLSPVEYAQIKHGRWIRDAENFGKYYCSECGFSYIPIDVPKYNFCPTCGARMDEVEE